jgi:hypothetical protein
MGGVDTDVLKIKVPALRPVLDEPCYLTAFRQGAINQAACHGRFQLQRLDMVGQRV